MKKLIFIIVALLSFTFKGIAQDLYIYGGEDHDVFLGCLTCSKYSSNSIWNAYGDHGSKYNSNSIWNAYGDFGSEYSSLSPWNEYATNPPVLVDKEGNFYGYLTANKYASNRADFDLALILYKYYDLIRDDVSKWYEKIFEE